MPEIKIDTLAGAVVVLYMKYETLGDIANALECDLDYLHWELSGVYADDPELTERACRLAYQVKKAMGKDF